MAEATQVLRAQTENPMTDSTADSRPTMHPAVPLRSAQEAYRDELFAAGVLLPLGPEGLVGRSAAFESVVNGITALVEDFGAQFQATKLAFPPVLPRRVIESTDYLKSFPDLLGSIHAFDGGERDHMALLNKAEKGENWAEGFSTTDAVLLPASCYPIYLWREGTAARREGEVFSLVGQCYRHEPSPDPARLRCFRQHEHVYLGSPSGASAFADAWGEKTVAVLQGLGLPAERVVANDPFFGRMGRLLAAQQMEQALKHEVVIPITSEEKPTACASVNQHHDHFTAPFRIALPGGDAAHTACVGFGLERVTLALFRHHGLDPRRWSPSVRSQLRLS